jgi:ATP-dependent helicase/nuclease subunit B
MHGVIDRVDSLPGETTLLIDYKTGSAAALKDKVKSPQEDTQLAFYAALMAGQSQALGQIEARYLALDESKDIVEVAHPDVSRSAEQLVAGLGRDLARIRAGEALPALGEGRACEHCDARGLCRRDHWPAEITVDDAPADAAQVDDAAAAPHSDPPPPGAAA